VFNKLTRNSLLAFSDYLLRTVALFVTAHTGDGTGYKLLIHDFRLTCGSLQGRLHVVSFDGQEIFSELSDLSPSEISGSTRVRIALMT